MDICVRRSTNNSVRRKRSVSSRKQEISLLITAVNVYELDIIIPIHIIAYILLTCNMMNEP